MLFEATTLPKTLYGGKQVKNDYHIYCLQPTELTNYGFVESCDRYEYKTSKGKEITVWKCKKHRTKNQMVFTSGSLMFSIEILYLFVRLVNDGIIEFQVENKKIRVERKIKELEEKLNELKEELKE